MRDFWVVFLLIGTMAWAQAKPAASAAASNSKQKPPSAPSVAADAPVLTIKGLCAQPIPNAAAVPASYGCQTVVTRAQFEQLVQAVGADKDAEAKRQLAKAYPEFLVMAHEAEQRGLDKQPRFAEKIRFARLQILSQELMGQIQQEAAQVPEKDIADYYHKHASDFDLANLERIVIPNRTQLKPQSHQQGAEQGKAAEDVMTKEAELLRGRAAAGEDFSKLQKAAYDAAGVSGNNAPNPSMGKMRRRSLPPAHGSVFDLKPGQVSQVISDATGHYIYKLDSKEIESLDAARPEISNTLRGQRMQEMIERLEQPFTTDVNDAYFGAEASVDSD